MLFDLLANTFIFTNNNFRESLPIVLHTEHNLRMNKTHRQKYSSYQMSYRKKHFNLCSEDASVYWGSTPRPEFGLNTTDGKLWQFYTFLDGNGKHVFCNRLIGFIPQGSLMTISSLPIGTTPPRTWRLALASATDLPFSCRPSTTLEQLVAIKKISSLSLVGPSTGVNESCP